MKNTPNAYQVQSQDQKIIQNLADVFLDNDSMKVVLGKVRDFFFKSPSKKTIHLLLRRIH